MLLTLLLTLVFLSPLASLSLVMTSLLVATFVSFLVRVLVHSGLGIVLQIQVLFMVFIICDPGTLIVQDDHRPIDPGQI